MTEGSVTIAIALGALFLQSVGLVMTGMRALGQTETKLRAEINNNKMASYTEMTQAIRSVGETFIALRQKITDVELYVRDHFLPKEAFGPIISELAVNIKESAIRIEARLQRMEDKIEAKHQHQREQRGPGPGYPS